jgi:hypothetical protein
MSSGKKTAATTQVFELTQLMQLLRSGKRVLKQIKEQTITIME